MSQFNLLVMKLGI